MKPPKTIILNLDETVISKEFIVNRGEQLTLVILGASAKARSAKVKVRLVGRGARAEIIGLVLESADNNLTLETTQNHEAPETTSNLLVKSLLSGNARLNYHGAIRVEKIAQKTDAYQRNENLLLSDQVKVQSEPELEILANDVRCTHGATISNLDKDELWYLKSRGISQDQSQTLITQGFMESAIAKISDKIVRDKIRRELWDKLSI